MSQKTTIEWATDVWNPVTGCTKVSEGCRHCYAETLAKRFWGERKFSDVQCHAERLMQPLSWRKPRRAFVNSMSDLFHEKVPFEFIDRVFAVMALCPQHTFIILTKRPERMAEWFDDRKRYHIGRLMDEQLKAGAFITARELRIREMEWPLPNVWLLASVENQDAAEKRIPHLLRCPAAVRGLSIEPMLGPVDLAYACFNGADSFGTMPGIHWVICGGERGLGARPMHPDWVFSLQQQCALAEVPFFFKQWGGPNKKLLGRKLFGVEYSGFPEVTP